MLIDVIYNPETYDGSDVGGLDGSFGKEIDMYCGGDCVKSARYHLFLPKGKYEETAKLYP